MPQYESRNGVTDWSSCGHAAHEGSLRLTRVDILFVVLAVGSGALVLYLGRSLTFWYDEWSFITFSGSAVDFLRPHNEHWSTLPLALYRATFALVQLNSYIPYLAELVAIHLLADTGA